MFDHVATQFDQKPGCYIESLSRLFLKSEHFCISPMFFWIKKNPPTVLLHRAMVHVLTNVSVMDPSSQHQTNSTNVESINWFPPNCSAPEHAPTSVHKSKLLYISVLSCHQQILPKAKHAVKDLWQH